MGAQTNVLVINQGVSSIFFTVKALTINLEPVYG